MNWVYDNIWIYLPLVVGTMLEIIFVSFFSPAEGIRLNDKKWDRYYLSDVLNTELSTNRAEKHMAMEDETKMRINLQATKLLRIKYGAELSECASLPYYDYSKTESYIHYKFLYRNLTWEDIITRVNIGLQHNYYSSITAIPDPGSLTVLVNKYNQLSTDYVPSNLEYILSKYSLGSLLLRPESRAAFEEMCHSARQEGIYLKAISSYRSYHTQEKVYIKKKSSDMPLVKYQIIRDRVSARAGHSEHQTGLAVDINSMNQAFGNTREGKWLSENSYQYGFILRYPKGKEEVTGYDYEPWHYRYLGKELATKVYQSGLSYDEYYVRFLSTP